MKDVVIKYFVIASVVFAFCLVSSASNAQNPLPTEPLFEVRERKSMAAMNGLWIRQMRRDALTT